MDPSIDNQNLPAMLQIMTTEHYNLQSGRSICVSEALGRASLFLRTVSTSLVAIAFIGQISRLGTAFYVFALLIFPSLFFLGLVTFQRVLQISLEDVLYARGINRIRHLYTEIAPQLGEYFVLSTSDDATSVYGDMAARSNWWQVYLTTPGMVGVINSLLAGVFLGLLASFLFELTLALYIAIGIVGFALGLLAFHRYQWITWGRSQASLISRFPRNRPIEQGIVEKS